MRRVESGSLRIHHGRDVVPRKAPGERRGDAVLLTSTDELPDRTQKAQVTRPVAIVARYRPAASAVLLASGKSAFQRPMDCSLTFSRRAASAIVISPASTLSAIRVFRSAGIKKIYPWFRFPFKD
ncbi:MAG: hypothetical protein QOI36_6066 [Pseudonocardiales bacterium]|nr:hypothetical protein [Pseudonocardiales bacterium]